MRLLERKSAGDIRLTKFFVTDVPRYAILSHTWGTDEEEVSYKDLMKGTGQNKPGYDKIRFCGEQASRDGFQFFWVDTCCIDRSSSAELQEAINSMFRWYHEAAKCYVYLADVSTGSTFDVDDKSSQTPGELAFRKSRWFTRGWTLQELIAPVSVDFFSHEGVHLGSKQSLEQDIQHITGIPLEILRGSPLSEVGVSERMAWIGKRETTRKEDKAYSLLGIFDVQMPLIYGEGETKAFRRLLDEIGRLRQETGRLRQEVRCMADLRSTDPRDDKIRIEGAKGGLLRDSYRWVLDNAEFQRWRVDRDSRLLWVKGDPGKGKTMLLCGIIDELRPSTRLAGHVDGALVSYFFCQATDSRINSATAVLRGLIYLLVKQQPSLISHIRTKYDDAGKALFEDLNALVALSEILTNILDELNQQITYLIIDALDECTTDLDLLLSLVAQKSAAYSSVKWVVSSRNLPHIEERLDIATQQITLCLELNEKLISGAVAKYICYKVDDLTGRKKYNSKTRDAIQLHLSSNANDTFLWVALVCQELEKVSRRKVFDQLNAFPPGLDSLYQRMMDQIHHSDDADLYRQILAITLTVYRPISLDELQCFIKILKDLSDDYESLTEIIVGCGSFLTVREHTVLFVHQSAKDFLLQKASEELFPCGRVDIHYTIFSRSLQAISSILRRDIYNLGAPGFPIDKVQRLHLDPDPLAAARYSCVYWIDHLRDCDASKKASGDLQDGGSIDEFLRRKYLYWLEALSLQGKISEGIVSMSKLKGVLQTGRVTSQLIDRVQDAHRFIQYSAWAIENHPLQVYASALIFSPSKSITRNQFKEEAPKWITMPPTMQDEWSACLQTLEGHCESVNSLAWSSDGTRLASGSDDSTVKIWDPVTGRCVSTLEGHGGLVRSVAWSYDGTRLASGSVDKTVKIWDPVTSRCVSTLEGHSASVRSVAWSYDGTRLASGSSDKTAKIWDPVKGRCVSTLKGHSDWVRSVAWSYNGTRLASGSDDNTVKIWDPVKGRCVSTLEGHSALIRSVAWSYDGTRLASGSSDKTAKIWDPVKGRCVSTLKGHSDWVRSVAWSYNGTRLASGSDDNTVKIWDPVTGRCVSTLESYSASVRSVAWSYDGTRLASGSHDNTVKIWDPVKGRCVSTLEGHSDWVMSVAWSYDGTRLASGSHDNTVKIWDPVTSRCVSTLEGHSDWVMSVAWSYDGTRLASGSDDNTVKIWDPVTSRCVSTIQTDLTNTPPSYLSDLINKNISDERSSATSAVSAPYSLDRHWITYQGEKLLWLPPEYRPQCYAISGTALAVGCYSGRVMILKISEDNPITWLVQ